jgi:hypothetical protein
MSRSCLFAIRGRIEENLPKHEPKFDSQQDKEEEEDRLNEEDDEDERLSREQEHDDEEDEDIYSDDMRANFDFMNHAIRIGDADERYPA